MLLLVTNTVRKIPGSLLAQTERLLAFHFAPLNLMTEVFEALPNYV